MRKLIKNFFWVGAFILTLPSAWGFSPGGPVGNGGDSWQTPEIGYGLTGDIMAPKNIGEEYRRVTPVMYYACDQNFLDFFGSAGLTNIDAAFAIMNAVTNVDSYSVGLSEWPLESQQINYTAQALGLTDLKSTTLGLLVEQMGLASPDRYVWTLHDRNLPAKGTCPLDEQYLVVQRNLDIINSPLNQVQYSPYINGTLYTFNLYENCTGPNPLADTVNYSPDPFASTYTAVASGYLVTGGFFTGLTRDDVAGLRYLWTSNNINYEATAPSGGVLVITNVQTPVQLPTQSFSLLFSQSVTTDPATLMADYPGLSVLSVTTNFVGQVITTNFAPYFTNQSVLPVFSNTVVGGLPVVHSLTNIYYFTNQPGPTVINYVNSDESGPWTEVDTLDLATFADAVAVDDPVTLQAAYPGLQILNVKMFPGYASVTNYVSYLTPWIGGPVGVEQLVTLSVITNMFTTNWSYTFGNVFTNHAYAKRLVTVQTVEVTNLIGAPYLTSVTYSNTATYYTNKVSGDFFLIPTNWCGFDLILSKSSTSLSSIAGTQTVNTNVNTTGYSATQNIYDTYTNYSYLVYPGICEPALVLSTNYSTNYTTTYQYYFGGLVTNSYSTNTWAVILTTNVSPCPGGSPDLLCTNISIVTNYINLPSGDFFIPNPLWCGYTILSTLQTNVVYTTNVVTSVNNTGGTDIGQYYTQTTVTAYTNHTLLVLPDLCSQAAPGAALRQGIGQVQFVRANYDSLLGQTFQPLTNYYTMVKVLNSQPVTEYYQRVVTRPDFLMTARDMAVLNNNNYIGAVAVARGINFDQSQILNNLAGPGTITPATTFTFDKVGTVYLNGSLAAYGLTTNAFLSESTQIPVGQWGSFDGSTNDPVIYPSGTSIANLVNQIYLLVSPAAVPDATNGVAYSQSFTATGGQPPYTWTAPNLSALVPGMSFNAATATLSGTPTAAGVFGFTLQLTDSGNRVVNLNYSITIH